MGKQLRICPSCHKLYDINLECECKKERDKKRREKKNEYQREYAERHPEVVKPIKTARWQRFRQQIIHRDLGHCQRCLIKYGLINSDELEVHHIKARIKRPDLIFDEKNCITLCRHCNIELGTGDLDFEPNPDLMNKSIVPEI